MTHVWQLVTRELLLEELFEEQVRTLQATKPKAAIELVLVASKEPGAQTDTVNIIPLLTAYLGARYHMGAYLHAVRTIIRHPQQLSSKMDARREPLQKNNVTSKALSQTVKCTCRRLPYKINDV